MSLGARLSRQPLSGARQDLRSFVDEVWLPWAQESQTSWRLSKHIADQHIIPVFGAMRLEQIRPEAVRAWLDGLERKNFALTTRNRFLCVFKTICNVAIKAGRLSSSPAGAVACGRPERAEQRLLPLPDMRRILHALENSRRMEAAIILLLLYTGASKSVILRARHEDLFLEENLLLHRSANGRARSILLPSEAVELARGLPKDASSPWLFPGRDRNRPLSDIFLFWNELRSDCGLSGLLLRDAQRSYAHWRFCLGNAGLAESGENQ